MKKVIGERLKDGSGPISRNKLIALYMSFILKITGKINIDFGDFDEVKEHPLVAPF